MNHKKVNSVYMTTDYDVFKYVDGNRNTTKKHINELIESFSERQLAVPIIIDKYFKIYDGQNRIEAIKQLGLPVYYIILDDMSIRDVQLLNATTKNWRSDEYATSYSLPDCKNNKEYIKYHSQLIKKLKKHSELLLDHAKYTGYLANIEAIYNKNEPKDKYVRLFNYKI